MFKIIPLYSDLFRNIQDFIFSETEIVYEEEDFIVFKDIRPAAEFHILIIPKNHFGPIQSLNKSHIEMLKKMEEIGQNLFNEKNYSQDDLLQGFHWPIYTINHLHLHFIAPKQQMNCFKKIEFSSWSFGNVQMAIEKLENT